MADKAVLVKARKQKRIEANNLSLISERRGFPVNSPLRMVTTTELDEDFSAMGVRQTSYMASDNSDSCLFIGDYTDSFSFSIAFSPSRSNNCEH